MVFYYWKIMVVAAEQGLLDEKSTKAAAASNVTPLLLQVWSESRLREARILIYFTINIMDDVNKALQTLQDFLQCLNDSAWTVERASTLFDIAEFQLKSDCDAILTEAEENFRRACELFSGVGHTYGNIDIDLARISADQTISAGEKFIAKTKIADRYFEVHHYQNGIRCLAFAISPDMIVDTYYEDVVKALELLDRKINEVGSEILKQVSLLHSVCQATLNVAEYGFALQSLESYYARVPEEISPKYHSYMAMMLALVYSSFGQGKRALQAAEQSLEIAMSGVSYADQSDAVTHVGVHRLSLGQQHPQGSEEAINYITSALDVLTEWADKDAEHGYSDGEIQKCLQIAGQGVTHDPPVGSEPAEQQWVERVKKHVPDSADPLSRSQLVDLEMRSLMRRGRYSESLALSADYLEQLGRVSGVPPFKKAQAFMSASIQALLCVRSSFQGGQSSTPESLRSAVKLLWTTVSLSYKALQLYRQTNGVELVLDCALFVWEVLDWATRTVTDTERRELLAPFLDELKLTEKVCDDMRRSVLPVGGLRNLMSKRLLVSKKSSLKLYNVGCDIALQLDDPAGAWLWLQRGKARAFADSLGASSAVPRRLLDRISTDQVAYGLLREEQSILELLREPNVNHVIAARRLASLRRKMVDHPLLAEAAQLKDALFSLELEMEELKEALLKTGLTAESVKFVDWYVPVSANVSNQPIILFVRQLDGTTHSKTITISAHQIRDWAQEAFQFPDMATPPLRRKTGNRLLKKMNALVEGLSDTTLEGDLLILSPSGPLHSVPLHALDVAGESLIQRNPVVYVSSTATLGQCLLRASIPRNKQEAGGTKYFAVYEELEKARERDEIFAHIRDMPLHLPGTVSLGPEVTKSHFLHECAGASWIHYHGHAHYSNDDVLKSSLVLSSGTDLFSQSPDNRDREPCEGVDRLLVPELFDAALPRGGVHFTIIACDSGTQEIAPGDEPLGITAALLYSGATSVLGCLWPIDSRAGRAFSEAFYAEIMQAKASPHEGVRGALNLASAMRATVSKMRKGELGPEFKQAYYWAPFTLHGLWYFPTQ